MINAFRARADELGTTRAAGRFRTHTTVAEGADRDRVVRQAVARAKEGDREAVRFLYVRYADNIYGYVRSIVRDEHEAEDVTQHVFAKLMTVDRQVRRARRAVLRLAAAPGPQRRDRPPARAPRDAGRGGLRARSRAPTIPRSTARTACTRRSPRCPTSSAASSCCVTSSA